MKRLVLACAAFLGKDVQAPAPATPVATPVAPPPAVPPAVPAATASPTVKLGLTVPGLAIAGSAPQLSLGQDADRYVVGVDGGGALTVSHSQGEVVAELLAVRDGRLHTKVPVQATHVEVGGLSVNGVPQWVLVARDDFDAPVPAQAAGPGWSNTATSSCGGVTMLGGYCNFAQGAVSRTLANLPPHTQLRIEATFHFIDRWVGETAFLKMDLGADGQDVPVWTESHSQDHEKHGLNVCGQEDVHEGKFAQRIDVSVPHTKPTAKLSFGTTMEAQDPCDESWGLSSLEVYVRTAA